MAPTTSFGEEAGVNLTLFAFSIALIIAVLLSGVARRTPLSTAVIFLAAGFIFGSGALNLIHVDPGDEAVIIFVKVALFGVLFADGLKLGIRDVLDVWRLPGRALLLGLPLTLLFIAVLARLILDLSWLESFLVGAVLSPTDPVFAAALVSKRAVPLRLRRLLNIESGLNDGLALPIVLLVLALIGVEEFEIATWITELVAGVAIGIAIPWTILKLRAIGYFSVTEVYRPLLGLSIGLLVFSASELVHANLFLAAFAAGITVASVDSNTRKFLLEYAETAAELLKLASLVILGALLSFSVFTDVEVWVYVFAALVLFAARPLAIGLALLGSRLDPRERLATAWFGPRGFASVVYGLLVLSSGIHRAGDLFEMISIVIVGSIIAHSTTDVLVARWFGSTASTEEAESDGEDTRTAEKRNGI